MLSDQDNVNLSSDSSLNPMVHHNMFSLFIQLIRVVVLSCARISQKHPKADGKGDYQLAGYVRGENNASGGKGGGWYPCFCLARMVD